MCAHARAKETDRGGVGGRGFKHLIFNSVLPPFLDPIRSVDIKPVQSQSRGSNLFGSVQLQGTLLLLLEERGQADCCRYAVRHDGCTCTRLGAGKRLSLGFLWNDCLRCKQR